MKNYISGLIILALVGLAGCGFRPVYSTQGENDTIRKDLLAITYAYEGTPVNQALMRALKQLINPQEETAPIRYILSFDTLASHGALAIQLNQEVTRYKTTVSLSYDLTDSQTGKLIKQGRLTRQGGYDVVQSQYAEHVSRQETEKRVTKELAEDLKLDLISAVLDRSKSQ
jgi:LPS-assembly lipoprotein